MFRKSSHKLLLGLVFGLLLLLGGYLLFMSKYASQAPKNLPESRKSIEQYFIETMHINAEEAKEMAKDGVDLRVSKDTTLQGVVGNLYYYGFIDSNESTFIELLKQRQDTISGKEGAIKVGNNTIDINASYYVNKDLTDEEVADTLLNKPRFSKNFSNYNYLFMPSGPGTGSSERPAR